MGNIQAMAQWRTPVAEWNIRRYHFHVGLARQWVGNMSGGCSPVSKFTSDGTGVKGVSALHMF
jgi:hypothetical protein